MRNLPAFTHIEGLAYVAKVRARRRLYTGKFGLMAQRVIEDCTLALALDAHRMALVTYVRETGDHACGWWKQPGLERCRRLSIVFRDRMTGAVLQHERETSLAIARAIFGQQVDLLWCEAPQSGRCKPAGHWHYRLFCDARGRAARPVDTVFSRENAAAEWQSWSDVVGQRQDRAKAA